MTVNLESFKGVEGQVAWYPTWTGLIDAVAAGINANSASINTLAAVTSGGFGLSAGTVNTSVVQPSDIHTELTYPSGTNFAIASYPDLYSKVAASLTDFTSIASGTVADLYAVVYNDSRLIAAGVQKSIYSTDGGATWNSSTTSPAKTVKSMATNGLTGASAIIVGVGDADYIGNTTGVVAGDVWSTATSPVLDTNFNWSDVKWFAGTINKFVAIGYKETSPSVFESKIASSAAGATWAIEKTIAGRFESIAYNNNDGAVDEFLIVGWGTFGSTHSAQNSSALNGTWTNVTVGGAATSYQFNSCDYYNDGIIVAFTIVGHSGRTGYKDPGASDITLFTTITGEPLLNRVVADDTDGVFYALGDTVGGLAYIYQVSGSSWVQEGVGAYALHGYANTGTARVIVGNGGTVFRTTSAAPGSFTLPYPATTALPAPFKYWVLTENVTTTAGGGSTAGTGDLSKLATGWFYVKVANTSVNYIRVFALSPLGVLVAGGDSGLLYKSTDYGNSWTDIGTGLGIAGNVSQLAFSAGGQLLVTTSSHTYAVNSSLAAVLASYTTLRTWEMAFAQGDNVLVALSVGDSSTELRKVYHTPSPTYGSTSETNYTVNLSGVTQSTTVNPEKQRVLQLNSKIYIPAILNDNTTSSLLQFSGVNLSVSGNDSVTKYTGGDISNFKVNTVGYSELYDEVLWVGRGGKAYAQAGALTSAPTEITTGISFDIEDCVFIAGAWVMLTRRGCLYTTDSATVTNLTTSNASITTKPAGNSLISIPSQFRLIANDLGIPGYVRVCQL